MDNDENINQKTTEESVAVDTPENELPYYKRFYLLFGGNEVPKGIDPTGTKNFIRNTLKYDGGELEQARKGKENSKKYADDVEETGERCSYCGMSISGVEYQRLPDGRARCTNCSRSVVTTIRELTGLLNDTKRNLETFFGASITVPVTVEFIEHRKLKRKTHPKGGAENYIILGVAIKNDNGYRICLENGCPKINVIATIAHEMTHIWQYTHWNQKEINKTYGKKNNLVIYEGMAKWAEIQYLYMLGEMNMAKREESITCLRDDEYGRGFLLYSDQYPISRETMSVKETPFAAGSTPLSS